MSENGRSHSEVYSDRVDPGGVVDALKVLAHPVRLQILQWLRDPRAEFPIERGIADPDEYGVCIKQITDKVGLAQSTVSAFMRALEREGLVTSTRIGKWTHYKRNEKRIAEIRSQVATLI
nr:metalloregulator ArsR/SmtB family transcription factor [uncultured Actinomyces sp.]